MSGSGGRRERLPACSPGYIDRTHSKYVRCVFNSAIRPLSVMFTFLSCAGTVLFMPAYKS